MYFIYRLYVFLCVQLSSLCVHTLGGRARCDVSHCDLRARGVGVSPLKVSCDGTCVCAVSCHGVPAVTMTRMREGFFYSVLWHIYMVHV